MMRRVDGVRACVASMGVRASMLELLASAHTGSLGELLLGVREVIFHRTRERHHAQRARRMVALRQCLLICVLRKANCFSQPASMRTRSAVTSLRSGATGELKDYSGAAGGLFGTYRIPASLFAGASAGAAFAMPIVLGEAATLGCVVSANNNNLHAIDATDPFPQVREAHLRGAHDQLAGLPVTSHRCLDRGARTPIPAI